MSKILCGLLECSKWLFLVAIVDMIELLEGYVDSVDDRDDRLL
ncbi:hypothetical protein [Francisella salimarina]